MKKFYVFILIAMTLILFQNATIPEFPLQNVDTNVIQKRTSDGKYSTTSPHIPANDFTLDGLIALRRKGSRYLPFFVMKPQRVINYLKDPRNSPVGANVMDPEEIFEYDFLPIIRSFYKNNPSASAFLSKASVGPTLICEKTDEVHNPVVCPGDRGSDCYRLTLVSRLGIPDPAAAGSSSDDEAQILRLSSMDVVVKVSQPKTINAKIDSVTVYDPDGSGPAKADIKISPDRLTNGILNEMVIAGDGRLLVARVGAGSADYRDESGQPKTADGINIIYSVYNNKDGSNPSEQCDVTRWMQVHPISYAHHDIENDMPNRYKFAKYPILDTTGEPVASGADMGGSYPWMDKEAANLFFTAFGTDNFYNFSAGQTVTPFIDNSTKKPTNPLEALTFEATGSRTVGVAMAGFWTHGKTVLFDGLINNADYNFTISSRRGTGRDTNGIKTYEDVDVIRLLNLYIATPINQLYEAVSSVREKGDGFDITQYDNSLTPNSNFIGSIENRLNYFDQMKTVTPRDIVWNFGTTRYADELVFDDFMNPHFLINAEMTGAVVLNDAGRSMRHLDGFDKGVAADAFTGTSNFTSSPLRFQNSATAPDNFLRVPKFGIPVGEMRLEPIAKGGIYGKGAWLEVNSGIAFEIPDQQGATLLSSPTAVPLYLSVFLDPRRLVPTGVMGTKVKIFSMSGVPGVTFPESVYLVVDANNPKLFNQLVLQKGPTDIASFQFPSGLSIPVQAWSHLAIQFAGGRNPEVYLNGFLAGSFSSINSADVVMQNRFFTPSPGRVITLGQISGQTSTAQISGLRGWVDDLKVLVSNPTYEEKCNYARGTIVKLQFPQNVGTFPQLASRYPASAHQNLSTALNMASDSRYVCYTKYKGDGSAAEKLTQNVFAHLKNLPINGTSVRHELLFGNKNLVYNQKRPSFEGNKFCLSCHLPADTGNTNPSMSTTALLAGTMAEQLDPRRQPLQPPGSISGVIPANYFGNGQPSTLLNSDEVHRIDQWILREP